jgi:hypothetical protein
MYALNTAPYVARRFGQINESMLIASPLNLVITHCHAVLYCTYPTDAAPDSEAFFECLRSPFSPVSLDPGTFLNPTTRILWSLTLSPFPYLIQFLTLSSCTDPEL